MTEAHTQNETIRLHRFYPEHEPRSGDSTYHLFNEAKARLKRQGLWRCVINNADCQGPVSLHHSHFEFAYANAIDVGKVNELLGLHLDDASFAEFVNSAGNLEALCFQHHTGLLGIHLIPTADWDTVRTHKVGITPVEVVRAPKVLPATPTRKGTPE